MGWNPVHTIFIVYHGYNIVNKEIALLETICCILPYGVQHVATGILYLFLFLLCIESRIAPIDIRAGLKNLDIFFAYRHGIHTTICIPDDVDGNRIVFAKDPLVFEKLIEIVGVAPGLNKLSALFIISLESSEVGFQSLRESEARRPTGGI